MGREQEPSSSEQTIETLLRKILAEQRKQDAYWRHLEERITRLEKSQIEIKERITFSRGFIAGVVALVSMVWAAILGGFYIFKTF